MSEASQPRRFVCEVTGDPAPWCVWTRRSKEPLSHQKMKSYQADIQAHAKRAMNGAEPTEGPVILMMMFYCPVKGFEKWDTTNLQKAAEDALKGIVFKDDRQVISAASQKLIAEKPWTHIEVIEVEAQ